MMSDLISGREMLNKYQADLCYGIACKDCSMCTEDGGCRVEEWIDKFPSADRPQGEWKPFDLTWSRSIYACSVCEEAIAVPCGWSDGKPIYDYCPMCGARMKGADDE